MFYNDIRIHPDNFFGYAHYQVISRRFFPGSGLIIKNFSSIILPLF